MAHDLDVAQVDAEGLIAAAAMTWPQVDAPQALHIAEEAGLGDGRARTRLLIAHLQAGDEDRAVALCTAAIAKRADLADFCRELLNHTGANSQTMKTFIGVVAATMPSHPAARLKSVREIVGRALYDAMWLGETLVVTAPLANGFPPSFEGVLVSTEEPLRRFTTFSTSQRVGDTVHLKLQDKACLTSESYWVAPPCLLMVGEMGAEPSVVMILRARVRRAWRRLTAMVNR